jgi:hypothetical protein
LKRFLGLKANSQIHDCTGQKLFGGTWSVGQAKLPQLKPELAPFVKGETRPNAQSLKKQWVEQEGKARLNPSPKRIISQNLAT